MIIERKQFNTESSKLFKEARQIELETLQEIDDKISTLRRNLRREKSDTFAKISNMRKKARELIQEQQKQIKEYIREIQAGQHGKGSPKIVLGPHEDQGVFPVITIGNAEDKTIIQFLDDETNAGSWESVRYIKVNRIISHEELQELFDALKEKSFLRYFPKDFIPDLEEGTEINLGGSSHHSGDINCYGTIKNGKMIVSIDYSGESGQYHRTAGIAPSIRWIPDLSAKYGGDLRNEEELIPIETQTTN